MVKKIGLLALVCVMVLVMCGCSGEMGMVGHYTIKEITAGNLTMTEDDIRDMGLESGYLEMTKSGKAEINILGDEYTGTWALNDDGTATVTYGNEEDEGLEGIATKEGKKILFKDHQGSTYTMERF